MGRRRKSGGRGNGTAAAKDSPQDNETPTSTPTPPPRVIGTERASATPVLAEAEAKPTDPFAMPSVEPAQGPAGAEVAAVDAPNTADAVAALNAYAYRSTLNAPAAAGVVVEDDDAEDKEAASMVDSTSASASAPRASGKRVVFVTSAATATPFEEEKLREARCVESVCTYCAVV
ncbi:hypothetical protein JIQ42_07829 [Leishmania sp. Namibia]|uniref:hypothetical protein n=1 Tax=Leishmania sp. Namibia TaxID=2802991 RepID=UPI001B7AA508|nr:hypothetical protein JIQ42_07829 [Leishmania sp. Namibia]